MDSIRQRVRNVQGSVPSNGAQGFAGAVSASMRSVDAVIREVAQSEVPVLLLAEAGAGKKATARRVHDLSRRRGQPFRVVSCASLKSENFADPAWQIRIAQWRYRFSQGTGRSERRGTGVAYPEADARQCNGRTKPRSGAADLRQCSRSGSGSGCGKFAGGSLLPHQRRLFAACLRCASGGKIFRS